MSTTSEVPFSTTVLVRDTCLCLHVQRAARALARRFDEALKPAGLTNGQFSLLMSLNRPDAPGVPAATIGSVAALLGMDRTSLTAALKPLVRRGLAEVRVAAGDRRTRRIVLTSEGRGVLASAVPIWMREHEELEKELSNAGQLRRDLRILES